MAQWARQFKIEEQVLFNFKIRIRKLEIINWLYSGRVSNKG